MGALVQTNYGGVLTIAGAPVGKELGRYYLREEVERPPGNKRASNDSHEGTHRPGFGKDVADGSVIIVVATDAPLDSRNLKRLASRAMMGLARTGSSGSNGSGDYVIAFSTASAVRVRAGLTGGFSAKQVDLLPNEAMSPLFEAVIEATEEAIYNSLFRAATTTGRGRKVEALPIERTVEILRKYRAIKSQ